MLVYDVSDFESFYSIANRLNETSVYIVSRCLANCYSLYINVIGTLHVFH